MIRGNIYIVQNLIVAQDFTLPFDQNLLQWIFGFILLNLASSLTAYISHYHGSSDLLNFISSLSGLRICYWISLLVSPSLTCRHFSPVSAKLLWFWLVSMHQNQLDRLFQCTAIWFSEGDPESLHSNQVFRWYGCCLAGLRMCFANTNENILLCIISVLENWFLQGTMAVFPFSPKFLGFSLHEWLPFSHLISFLSLS